MCLTSLLATVYWKVFVFAERDSPTEWFTTTLNTGIVLLFSITEPFSYAILAADAAKSSDDVKAASVGITDKLVKDGNLNDDEFKIGNTKIFFRAGILARLEDIRDEILAKIMVMFQSRIRWYLGQAEARRRQEQQTGLLLVQRNVRAWCTLRTWEWFKLFGKVSDT